MLKDGRMSRKPGMNHSCLINRHHIRRAPHLQFDILFFIHCIEEPRHFFLENVYHFQGHSLHTEDATQFDEQCFVHLVGWVVKLPNLEGSKNAKVVSCSVTYPEQKCFMCFILGSETNEVEMMAVNLIQMDFRFWK